MILCTRCGRNERKLGQPDGTLCQPCLSRAARISTSAKYRNNPKYIANLKEKEMELLAELATVRQCLGFKHPRPLRDFGNFALNEGATEIDYDKLCRERLNGA